jgi:parallel beta-helix repeat protein
VTPSAAPSASSTPTAPVAGPVAAAGPVCGNNAILAGPAAAPAGAITVPAGNNSAVLATSLPVHTAYWLAPGIHTLGSGQFAQIQPGDNDTFIGAPGAILSGQDLNNSAFDGTATGVTIMYLTIEDFTPAGSQGAVNHDSGANWTITNDTIQGNSPGAGTMLGTNNTLSNSCLTRNGEYGFNAYVDPASSTASALTHGPSGITMTGNEISLNNTCNFEDVSPNPVPASLRPSNCGGAGEGEGCGCAGAGKFWQVDNAVVDSNDVHDNYDVGLWADTNNNGFTVEGNNISDNYGPGFQYEISYNALIEDNTFTGNAIGEGPTNPGFATGAIYLSESGGDSRVPNTAGITTITVSGNTFTNNWSGVVDWESSDRFCGSPDNSSTGTCTLVDPSVANNSTCSQANLTGATPSGSPDYYDLCRWKTQNVHVTGNTFNITPSAVPGCDGTQNSCGENGLFSQYGTSPSWSPYKAGAVETAITTAQDNTFSGNTFVGPWEFMYFDQSTILSLAQAQAKGLS